MYISMVMSIGLLVDYVMHVTYRYMEVEGKSREEKVKKTLETIGASVMVGGVSTLIGVLPLGFSSSEIFFTVFIVFFGLVLLGLLPGLPSFGGSGKLGKKIADLGVVGSGLLGFLFALAFCPVSAALFFGSLLPLAVKQESTWLLPALFGVGSALPVLVFGILLTVARQTANKAFGRLQQCDKWLLPATGWLLVAVGLYLIVRQWMG